MDKLPDEILCRSCIFPKECKDPHRFAPAPYYCRGHKGMIKICMVCGHQEDVAEDVISARSCRICGCTEECACRGGCSWIEWDLCNAHLKETDLRELGIEKV